MLGKLSFHALNNGPIVLGGQLTMVFGALFIAGVLTYKKRWSWLWKEWLTSLDPKKIGVMYIIVALVMLLRGAADAGMMRAQQARQRRQLPRFLSSDHFQQIFSAHGTIMIFFVAMGLMFGLINLMVPLQIGARDVAFPFLNAISFWLFAAGMLLINISLAVGEFSAAGWLAYPPLSELPFSPGVGVDYWIWALQIAGVGSLLSGINFFVTILKMRRAGHDADEDADVLLERAVHDVAGDLRLSDPDSHLGHAGAGPHARHALLHCRRRRQRHDVR